MRGTITTNFISGIVNLAVVGCHIAIHASPYLVALNGIAGGLSFGLAIAVWATQKGAAR